MRLEIVTLKPLLGDASYEVIDSDLDDDSEFYYLAKFRYRSDAEIFIAAKQSKPQGEPK